MFIEAPIGPQLAQSMESLELVTREEAQHNIEHMLQSAAIRSTEQRLLCSTNTSYEDPTGSAVANKQISIITAIFPEIVGGSALVQFQPMEARVTSPTPIGVSSTELQSLTQLVLSLHDTVKTQGEGKLDKIEELRTELRSKIANYQRLPPQVEAIAAELLQMKETEEMKIQQMKNVVDEVTVLKEKVAALEKAEKKRQVAESSAEVKRRTKKNLNVSTSGSAEEQGKESPSEGEAGEEI